MGDIEWLQKTNTKGGIGIAVYEFGEAVWKAGKSKPLTYGPYGQVVTSPGYRGTLLNTKVAKGIKGVGTGMAIFGSGLDTYSAYNSFKSGNVGDGVSSSASAVGATVGLFVPPIGLFTALGAGLKMVGEWGHGKYLSYKIYEENKRFYKKYLKLYGEQKSRLDDVSRKLDDCERK